MACRQTSFQNTVACGERAPSRAKSCSSSSVSSSSHSSMGCEGGSSSSEGSERAPRGEVASRSVRDALRVLSGPCGQSPENVGRQ